MSGPVFQNPTLSFTKVDKYWTHSYLDIIKLGPIHTVTFEFLYHFIYSQRDTSLYSNIFFKTDKMFV